MSSLITVCDSLTPLLLISTSSLCHLSYEVSLMNSSLGFLSELSSSICSLSIIAILTTFSLSTLTG